MLDFAVLEPAIDPNNRISFLLDWEVTMKCNLDCSYCKVGINGGHDNSTAHPALDSCLQSIDFMFEYADIYMRHKPQGIRYVILNLYGGESLHHPEIHAIIQRCREVYLDKYKNFWNLTITTTTNAIIGAKKIARLIPLIDEFTCSYHSENTVQQKEEFKRNVLAIRDAGKRVKIVVLMHPTPELFKDTKDMIDWCQNHGIKHLPRQLDHDTADTEFNYSGQQVKWFDTLYKQKSYNTTSTVIPVAVADKFDMCDTGRACCGGRQVCKDQHYRQRDFFVHNKFTGWSCSVNHFFLYIKQITGDIYVNKDCRMAFDQSVGPIGHLSRAQELLEWTQQRLEQRNMPVIRCAKKKCWCGLCAPKAAEEKIYHQIMQKYVRCDTLS